MNGKDLLEKLQGLTPDAHPFVREACQFIVGNAEEAIEVAKSFLLPGPT